MSETDSAVFESPDSAAGGGENGTRLASLLRLFKSEFFDMSMAIMYLHRYKDEEVHKFICGHMEAFQDEDIEFYLPQILELLIENTNPDATLQRFLLDRCCKSVRLSLQATWLLRIDDRDLSIPPNARHNRMQALMDTILNLPPSLPMVAHDSDLSIPSTPTFTPVNGKGHRRCASDVPATLATRKTVSAAATPERPPPRSARPNMSASYGNIALLAAHHKDLDSGTAFDFPRPERVPSKPSVGTPSKYVPPATPATMAQCTAAEQFFVSALTDIGIRLAMLPTREIRRAQLFSELTLLNLNLPARVFLPLSSTEKGHSKYDHHVVHIPPQEAILLNSKDKAPFLIHVEVVDCEDGQTSILPAKSGGRPRHTRHASIDSNEFHEDVTQHRPAVSTPDKEQFIPAAEIRRRLSRADQVHVDPAARACKEPWIRKVERIRCMSPYGHLPHWRLLPVIVKSGDDLRQELFAAQLLTLLQKVWEEERLSLWLRPLRILVTSDSGGLLEVVGEAVSLHQARQSSAGATLLDYFVQEFGPQSSEGFLTAQRNFVESLAASSLFCYFVQVKDRHNGNILLDGQGHLLHIDFGFILSNSPRNLGFETAPFKLTEEFIDVMGGCESDMFRYFKILLLQGFIAARKHMERLVVAVEIMQKNSELPCFVAGEDTLRLFSERFQITLTEEQLNSHVEQLIMYSIQNVRTRLYDGFQYLTNGIL
eukprot:m.41499 g.41499  ORF g.41499 m.41499 type:complete len:711 (+) comp5674_c0_seq2:24-2156(+)